MRQLATLNTEENKKYSNAISKGYFKGYSRKWRHTFVGSFVWKYPNRIKVMDTFKDIIGHLPAWERGDIDIINSEIASKKRLITSEFLECYRCCKQPL